MLYNVNEQRSSLRTREVDSFLFCNILKDKEGYRPMDEIDLKLLRLLQKNSRTPIKTLAGEVRLSSPAVSARIERLEKQGAPPACFLPRAAVRAAARRPFRAGRAP